MPHQPIRMIVVHCTATIEGKDYTTKDINDWHYARGFRRTKPVGNLALKAIGYHEVLDRYGTWHPGRDHSEVGAHVSGHNTGSLGLSYIGGVDARMNAKDTRTDAQKAALVSRLRELVARYPTVLPSNGGKGIRGHRDFAAKACPSFDATREYAPLLTGGTPVVVDPRLPVRTSVSGLGIVTASILNVRATPGGAVVGKLPKGYGVSVFGRDGEWLRVGYDWGGQQIVGWVSAAYIAKD